MEHNIFHDKTIIMESLRIPIGPIEPYFAKGLYFVSLAMAMALLIFALSQFKV